VVSSTVKTLQSVRSRLSFWREVMHMPACIALSLST
jgi:hypothetical protein